MPGDMITIEVPPMTEADENEPPHELRPLPEPLRLPG